MIVPTMYLPTVCMRVVPQSPPPSPPPYVHGCAEHDNITVALTSPSGFYSDDSFSNKCYGFVRRPSP